MAIHIFMGVTLDVSFTGAAVTTIDKFAFPGVGVLISILSWIALTRPRLRANEDGVEVRNIVGTRFYPWQVVYGLSFPEGSVWPASSFPISSSFLSGHCSLVTNKT